MYIKKNYQVSTQIPANPEVMSLDQLARYLNGIQVDINNLHRELTYWDIYKINYVIDDVSKANSIINNLAPGQAAVVGFEKTASVDGDRRSRGDVVIKLIDNTLFWIKSRSSGIYKPDPTYNSTDHCFTYTYTNITPPEGDPIAVSANPVSPRQFYGTNILLTASDSSKTFLAISNVRPIIRFYTSTNEIIDVNHTLTLISVTTSNDTYRVDWNANPLLANGYLQVK